MPMRCFLPVAVTTAVGCSMRKHGFYGTVFCFTNRILLEAVQKLYDLKIVVANRSNR